MLEQVCIISLMVWAVFTVFQETMIFGFCRQWLDRLPEIIRRPLYDCVICMTPWWGTAAYWIFFGHSIVDWVITFIAATGLTSFLLMLLNAGDD